MNLTTCEGNQLIEATQIWFGKNGGPVEITIKKVEMFHDHDEHTSLMPEGFSKHKVSKKFYKKPLKGYFKK